MKILIFSGTTEGRILSGMLSECGLTHTVCVATGYGSDVMPKNTQADIRVGRMDENEMEKYLADESFGSGDIVVDATHPYATEVSRNIEKAAERSACRLIKISRGGSEPDKSEGHRLGPDKSEGHKLGPDKPGRNELGPGAYDGGCDTGIKYYASMEDFAHYADGLSGNILLTTGSGTLQKYRENVSDKTIERTYVRVLPSTESIDICKNCGIEPGHIIAMQGPFSYEMNRALLAQYDIAHMLTKDSGPTGGLNEKIQAAKDVRVTCHVLSRPGGDEGVSIYEAYKTITGNEYKKNRIITLAGAGMGDEGSMTVEVKDAIAGADAVFGAKRLLAKAAAKKKYEMFRAVEIIEVLKQNKDIMNAVILYSGDTGFYSGAKEAYETIAAWDESAKVTILPGISSVSYLAAKTGVSYDDATLVSIHGRNEKADIDRLIETVRFSEKTFVLTSGADDIRTVGKLLCEKGINADFYIGRNLGAGADIYDGSSPGKNTEAASDITILTAAEAAEYKGEGVITVLIINRDNEADLPINASKKHEGRPLINVLSDKDMIRDKVPMTKECIRHESIIKLNLHVGDTVYDVGGGTGSVACEIASIHPSLNVITMERDEKAVELINKNVKNLGLDNVTVIRGQASEVIPKLPYPDCIFIGGSGGELREIISLITAKGSGIRFVVNAVSLETIEEVRHVIKETDAQDVETVMIQVSDIKTVGSHHMMDANNPVTIFSFTI
ncbi:MAG: precorrin-6y C5,15-methyltransferase (decarboxylating) subunit CbiE [Lachnospiraceae bacterium]|nr:precorrin-6y C5,15-methyltransferase (decarboxylating) subunit CbiE [Lachnospiraceae bacterium]